MNTPTRTHVTLAIAAVIVVVVVVVAAPGCEIRIDFAQIRHTSSEGDFYATFSCGVAWFPRYATSVEIESAAERAVRQVKALGGNRVGLIGRHES